MRTDKVNYYLDIAQQVAKRGTCLRRNYGAIIVQNDEIISTGYCGSPRGTENCCDLGVCKRQELKVPSGERYELCLAGDTVIKLSDGTYETIESLSNKDISETGVYSKDISTGEIISAQAFNIHKTGVRKDIVEIILDNGKSIRCTSDHLILMSNGVYKKAMNLKPEDGISGMGYAEGSDSIKVKILKVKEIKTLNVEIPVYDMSVPEFENFAVDLGDNSCIFVHNCRSVHAEQNAIISAARRDMIGSTLYLVGLDAQTGELNEEAECCMLCKRLIMNAGISQVIIRRTETDYDVQNVALWSLSKDL